MMMMMMMMMAGQGEMARQGKTQQGGGVGLDKTKR